MMRLKGQSGYFYLLCAALASWVLLSLTDVETVGNRLLPPHSPNFFSTGYSKWEMDTNGRVGMNVFADYVIHYSDDKTTRLQKPSLYFHHQQQAPWVVQAESGVVSADSKDVLLQGQTLITRDAYGNNKALKIITSNLKVKPDIHYAETDDKAVLLSPSHKTTGIGMKLVFKPPIHIELLAHVQGKYETQR